MLMMGAKKRKYLFNIAAITFGMTLSLVILFTADRLIYAYPQLIGRHSKSTSSISFKWSIPTNLEDQSAQTRDFDEKIITYLAEKEREKNFKIFGYKHGHEEMEKLKILVPNKIYAQNAKSFSNSGDLVYDTIYRYDFSNRRLTKTSLEPLSDIAVLLLGCSFTFGEGLPEEESYPYMLSELLSKSSTYNMSVRGSAANGLLKKMSESPHFFKVPAKKIILVYNFFHDHLDREYCPYDCLFNSKWKLQLPHFELSDGELIYSGTHGEYYSNSFLLKIAQHFKSLTQGPLLFPAYKSTAAIQLHFRILHEIKEQLSKTYEVIDAYQVYLDPFPEGFVEHVESYNIDREFKPIISPRGRVLDEFNIDFSDSNIRADGHPNALTNYIVSRTLMMRLKKDHPELF